jgi:hypothetical protein
MLQRKVEIERKSSAANCNFTNFHTTFKFIAYFKIELLRLGFIKSAKAKLLHKAHLKNVEKMIKRPALTAGYT